MLKWQWKEWSEVWSSLLLKESLSLIQGIDSHYQSFGTLAVVCFLFIVPVGYAGFLQANELLSLQVLDITIFDAYMSIYVPERRMINIVKGVPCQLLDPGKLHAWYPLQKSYCICCRLAVTRDYVSLRGLFRLSRSSVSMSIKALRILELKTSFGNILGCLRLTRRSLFCKLSNLVPASNPGCRLLNSDNLDRHAGWNNPTLKNRHIKYPVNDLLQVSKSLRLWITVLYFELFSCWEREVHAWELTRISSYAVFFSGLPGGFLSNV